MQRNLVKPALPGDQLLKAGVRPERKKVYELANGQPVEHEIGFARVSFMGEETVVQMIFGPPGVEPILGVVALENVGIVVDPVTQTLKRLHASPLKQAARGMVQINVARPPRGGVATKAEKPGGCSLTGCGRAGMLNGLLEAF